MKTKTLAVDFDLVIHDIDHPIAGRRMGPPMPGAVNGMAVLKRNGYKLIVHTLWALTPAGKNACQKWLEYWLVPYDEVTATKPAADAYIDDKGIRFYNWERLADDLKELL